MAEYDAAAAGARRPEHYRDFHHLLRLWRLRAVAYSDPGFDAARDAAGTAGPGTPIEQIVPDWDERAAAVWRRRAAS
jgi:hypothetical protein